MGLRRRELLMAAGAAAALSVGGPLFGAETDALVSLAAGAKPTGNDRFRRTPQPIGRQRAGVVQGDQDGGQLRSVGIGQLLPGRLGGVMARPLCPDVLDRGQYRRQFGVACRGR